VPLVFMTVAAENPDQSAIGQRVDYALATEMGTVLSAWVSQRRAGASMP